MRRTVFTATIAVVGMILLGGVAIETTQARELEGQKPDRRETGEVRGLGKEGSTLLDPPADPQCPRGSSNVGPMHIRTFPQPCKGNGKDGIHTCISKTQPCVGGVGVPPSVSTYNCGPCMVLPSLPKRPNH